MMVFNENFSIKTGSLWEVRTVQRWGVKDKEQVRTGGGISLVFDGTSLHLHPVFRKNLLYFLCLTAPTRY